jgi:predicted membrane channel-forming protein YqfA (hemolysin III family)
MALSYKARRRWSLVVLLIWLPFYIIVAVSIMTAIPRLPMPVELLIYLVLGVAWVIPFKFIFKGVGKEDPDA